LVKEGKKSRARVYFFENALVEGFASFSMYATIQYLP
jgi:hypothetical protein